jgi:hypothetical protein
MKKENILYNASPKKESVEFKILYDMEYEYWFSNFFDHVFKKIIVKDNIIEFCLPDKLERIKLSDFYHMNDVYPFLYEIENSILILTRIHYADKEHLLKPLGDFKYYSIESRPFKDCFCSNYHIVKDGVNIGEHHHYNHMKSTQGYVYNHCTLYTLYNSDDVQQVCSDCSLLKIGQKVYGLYTSTYPNISDTFQKCVASDICQDVIDKILEYNEPPYNQVSLYEHVLDGDEPGYYSNGGDLDLELISYKMGVKVVSDIVNVQDTKTGEKFIYKAGETVFDYGFDYKTSKLVIEVCSNKIGRLYLHRGSAPVNPRADTRGASAAKVQT